jgi:pimeloyl-ACP methyl ester carboxylesterase
MPRLRPWLVKAIAIASVVAMIAAVVGLDVLRRQSGQAADQLTNAAFYALPSPLPEGSPGDLIRSKPISGTPFGTNAWRVIYHSRDLAGRDIPVSGVVIVPSGLAPAGGRTVVAWAHPTTGAAPDCGPSVAKDPFQLIEGMHLLLAAGFAIAATDYPGMGVAGESSYLLGVPESNSMLDSVRAAEQIPNAHANKNVLLWGHSQGGQTALIAAERATQYSPELHIKGVAVAAPAADLGALMTANLGNIAGVTITSLAVTAYTAAYADRDPGSHIDDILTPQGAAATPEMSSLCLLTQTAKVHAIATPLIGNYVTSDPATTEPWTTLLAENSAGGSPIDVPIFVGQGLADKLVVPAATQKFVAGLCTAGENVSFHEYPGITHALAAYASLPALTVWLAQVSAGQTPSTCDN